MALHQIPAGCACYLGGVGPFTPHPVGRVSLQSRVATLDYSMHLKQWTHIQYAPETVDTYIVQTNLTSHMQDGFITQNQEAQKATG